MVGENVLRKLMEFVMKLHNGFTFNIIVHDNSTDAEI